MYYIKVVICDEMDDMMDNLKEIEDCQECFKKSIEKVIKETNIYPLVGDWIVPIKGENGTTLYDIGCIKGRNFNPNEKYIEYEIS